MLNEISILAFFYYMLERRILREFVRDTEGSRPFKKALFEDGLCPAVDFYGLMKVMRI